MRPIHVVSLSSGAKASSEGKLGKMSSKPTKLVIGLLVLPISLFSNHQVWSHLEMGADYGALLPESNRNLSFSEVQDFVSTGSKIAQLTTGLLDLDPKSVFPCLKEIQRMSPEARDRLAERIAIVPEAHSSDNAKAARAVVSRYASEHGGFVLLEELSSDVHNRVGGLDLPSVRSVTLPQTLRSFLRENSGNEKILAGIIDNLKTELGNNETFRVTMKWAISRDRELDRDVKATLMSLIDQNQNSGGPTISPGQSKALDRALTKTLESAAAQLSRAIGTGKVLSPSSDFSLKDYISGSKTDETAFAELQSLNWRSQIFATRIGAAVCENLKGQSPIIAVMGALHADAVSEILRTSARAADVKLKDTVVELVSPSIKISQLLGKEVELHLKSSSPLIEDLSSQIRSQKAE